MMSDVASSQNQLKNAKFVLDDLGVLYDSRLIITQIFRPRDRERGAKKDLIL